MTQDTKLFAVPLGVDFPTAFVKGLLSRYTGQPPHALARAHVIVNSARMRRRVRDVLIEHGALLHLRLHLVTDLTDLCGSFDRHAPKSALAVRLELVGLVTRLIDAQPDIAARTSVFALADSLATLIDEIQSEGIAPDVIANLDVPDQSGHWARSLEFLKIVQTYLEHRRLDPDSQAFLRQQITELNRKWQENPILEPVFIAGSTGSRGTTLDLMRTVASLPNGAIILPGYDCDMPPEAWDQLNDPLMGQDHPQYRIAHVARALQVAPHDIASWTADTPVHTERNALLSLALRPAPVTDTWRRDGPNLPSLTAATKGITWVEAPTKRAEALAIALRLRKAVEDNETIALITPDRQLTRQVTAALDKWNILPDDSAGLPLQLSPPGRFMRHVAGIIARPVTVAALLALLKHPLTHSAGERGLHLLLTRELELYLRRDGIPFPNADILTDWAQKQKESRAMDWAAWINTTIFSAGRSGIAAFSHWVDHHLSTALAIAAGFAPNPDAPTGELWRHKAGSQVQAVFDTMIAAAPAAQPLDIRDYTDIFSGILAQGEVRDFAQPHPNIMILGALEARVQNADTVILSGLNEGVWPDPPAPDPWLNRKIRIQAGLLLPERRIGLAAHDFQTAVLSGDVWITRALRSDDAETVPSRWINRLSNLLGGLPDQSGPAALEAMKNRGQEWLDLATQYDTAAPIPAAKRPSVIVPLFARPKELSVTEIRNLIRDPYSVYAKRVLRLRRLESLDRTPDARLRGIIIHDVMDRFCREWDDIADEDRVGRLIALTRQVLEDRAPWALTQLMWQSRMIRIADWFVDAERKRRAVGMPVGYERRGKLRLDDLDFTLTAIADRIDALGDGVAIYDYKTGTPPTSNQQMHFDKQLYLLSMIAEDGGFDDLDPVQVVTAAFIGLGSSPKEQEMPTKEEDLGTARAKFRKLIQSYADPDQGYTARRALFRVDDFSDYDQLSRFGEWDVTDPAHKDRLS